MISYSLNSDGVFYVLFSETVTFEELKEYLEGFAKLVNPSENLLSLYDLRDAELNVSTKDLSSIIKMSDKITANYNTIRTAFLVDKPNLTAYSLLFTEEAASKNAKREVFSSKEAALNWLTG